MNTPTAIHSALSILEGAHVLLLAMRRARPDRREALADMLAKLDRAVWDAYDKAREL